MQQTSTIPIVASGSADPVGQGLVTSLNRPGGNVTALISNSVEMAPKCLEMLRDTFPGITRVAVFFHPPTPGSAQQWAGVQAAAPKLGVSVHGIEVFGEDDVETGFMATAGRADAVLVIQSAVIQLHTDRIIALAAQHRLPSIYQTWQYVVHGGGLMSYEAEHRRGQYRRTADYVAKILNGANVGELPVESPTHFRLSINLKTAEALGLIIPPAILQQATEIVQ